MKWLLDGLVVLMLAALAAVLWFTSQSQQEQEALIVETRQAVRELERRVLLESQIGESERSGRGYPLAIEPSWFDGAAVFPDNPLVGRSHPWLEIAPAWQSDLDHPPHRVATDRSMARFWYNPSNGVVRARVPGDLSDAQALELYNRINGVSLSSLYESAPGSSQTARSR